MKRTVTYPSGRTYEYDDESPCIVCGEPVTSASMGGTAICPWCDTGRCRYCDVRLWVVKEELDGGESKRELLDHMKWHREREPELNKLLLESAREFHKKIQAEKAEAVS